jgi:hypothetical protein
MIKRIGSWDLWQRMGFVRKKNKINKKKCIVSHHRTIRFESLETRELLTTLTWTGAISQDWDTSTLNWHNSLNQDVKFTNGDNVVFNDTVSDSHYSPILTNDVSPASIRFAAGNNFCISSQSTHFMYGNISIEVDNSGATQTISAAINDIDTTHHTSLV